MAIERSDRRDINDDTTLTVLCHRLVELHDFRTKAKDIECADEVYAHNVLELCQRHGAIFTHRSRSAANAGRIHVNVYRAKLLFRQGYRLRHSNLIGYVACVPSRIWAQTSGGLLERVGSQIIEHDMSARCQKMLRRG